MKSSWMISFWVSIVFITFFWFIPSGLLGGFGSKTTSWNNCSLSSSSCKRSFLTSYSKYFNPGGNESQKLQEVVSNWFSMQKNDLISAYPIGLVANYRTSKAACFLGRGRVSSRRCVTGTRPKSNGVKFLMFYEKNKHTFRIRQCDSKNKVIAKVWNKSKGS